MSFVFGPVPSRRLGRSLGINHIPPKACSYACVYCQVGPTRAGAVEPRPCFPPGEIAGEVAGAVQRLRARGEPIDFLTFVPDGEPTLDAGLQAEIELLRPLGIPIAVISNGSLAWQPEPARALASADWVSLKVDTVDEATWRRVNRPHHDLRLPTVLEGIRRFAAGFRGRLVGETMLVGGINDGAVQVQATADFLAEAGIDTTYLAVPIRPPTLSRVVPPDPEALTRAHQIMSRRIARVELLNMAEPDTFTSSDDPSTGILSICAVHPMRESAVRALLNQMGAPWSVVEDLIAAGSLREVPYQGERFYLPPFRAR